MKVFAVLMAAAFVFACASEKSEVANPTAAQKTSAQNVVKDIGTLNGIKTADKDFNTPVAGVTGAIGDAYNFAFSFVTPQTGYGMSLDALALAEECAVKSGDTITYNCTYTGGGIKGTIKVSGDTITIDLTISSSYQGTTVDVVYKGSVTTTKTSINGSLSGETKASGAASGTGYSYSYKVDVKYNNIVVDDKGCPTGGSTEVKADIKATAAGYSQSYSVDVEAKYGPACGDVKIYK
jgi:hypothetical protein